MTRAIFRSVSQAIHFAWIIKAYEASPDGIMAKLLRMKMLELGLADGSREPSSVNFGGLTALEVRGQCAMVRSAVTTTLPGPESWAVVSRFGQTVSSRQPNGNGTLSFSAERVDAIMALADYLHPTISCISRRGVMWLIARAVGECEELRPSFRKIEEETGDNRETLRVKFKDVRDRVFLLVNLGLSRLEPRFKQDGLVEDEEAEAVA